METYIGKIDKIYKLFVRDGKAGKFIKDKVYKCEIKELKGGKSDAQRARYWAMVRKYARLAEVSQWHIHNINMHDLGIAEKDGNGEDMEMLLDENYDWEHDYRHHLKETKKRYRQQDGTIKKLYTVLKSSEEFTTDEYSELISICINNIIQDGFNDKIDIYYGGEI